MMKHGSTTPVSTSFAARASLVAAAVLIAASSVYNFAPVFARDFDAEIKAKEQEAQKYSQEAERLGEVASSLEEALAQLNGQIGAIQNQISESQQKYTELEQKITQTEEKIAKTQKTLGQVLSDMHVDDDISPLEMLASSENIGDFIDKQEQRTSLRRSLSTKIKEVKSLKKELESSKEQVEAVLSDQKAQRGQLASKQAEQQKLLNQTQSDKDSYNQLASSRNAEIGKLREQQKKANCEAFGGIWSGGVCTQPAAPSGGGGGVLPSPSSGNGGYPAVWANAPQDSLIDKWGMYNRECVSYVAYRIAASGRYMPYWGGVGNAYQWPSNARAAGIPVGSSPKAGAAAVMYGGPYGHVMYVESVNGDGTITVSDYNLGVDGLYRHYTRSASGLTYIYF